MTQHFRRHAIAALAASALLVALVLFEILPVYPTDVVGWLLLLLVGVPLYVAAELGGEVLVGGAGRLSSSFARITTLVLVLVLLCIVGAVVWRNVADDVAPHFRELRK